MVKEFCKVIKSIHSRSLANSCVFLLFLLSLISAVPAASSGTLIGAGASFPAPLYFSWSLKYKVDTGKKLNYQVMGSAGGQIQLLNGAVDFGATDVPVSAEKLLERGWVQFPSVIGAEVIVVNVDGVENKQLKLTGEILADIYMGKITNWNDKAIADINPDLSLPDLTIVPVYRSEGSGTTFIFTSYLQSVSQEWSDNFGVATSIGWPTGMGAKGNDTVAATVKNTRGAIGYVEYAYAVVADLVTTKLKNKDGYFVSPEVSSFEAAAANVKWGQGTSIAPSMINMFGESSWPIISATHVLLNKNSKKASKLAGVVSFFDWAFSFGDDLARNHHYLVLPEEVKDIVRNVWMNELKDDTGESIWTPPVPVDEGN